MAGSLYFYMRMNDMEEHYVSFCYPCWNDLKNQSADINGYTFSYYAEPVSEKEFRENDITIRKIMMS